MQMVSAVFDLYGSPNPDLTAVTLLVSRLLAMEFLVRSSDERGDYYISHGSSGDDYKIMANEVVDEEGRYNTEEDFAEYPTLLTVNHSPSADDVKRRLSGQAEIVFLRRTTFSDNEREYG